MGYWVPVGATHALVAILSFTDGGPDEEQILHMGTEESCLRVRALVPGIAYKGDRPGASAVAGIYPLPDEWRSLAAEPGGEP